MSRSGEGGRKNACHVTPDLSYDYYYGGPCKQDLRCTQKPVYLPIFYDNILVLFTMVPSDSGGEREK